MGRVEESRGEPKAKYRGRRVAREGGARRVYGFEIWPYSFFQQPIGLCRLEF